MLQLVIRPSPTHGFDLVAFETATHKTISVGLGASATITVIVSTCGNDQASSQKSRISAAIGFYWTVSNRSVVPRVGLEPTLSCPNWILNPTRLPISPPRHGGANDKLFCFTLSTEDTRIRPAKYLTVPWKSINSTTPCQLNLLPSIR